MGKENAENPTLKTDISIYEAFFNAQSEFGIVPATAANSYYKKADGKASAYSSLADIERTIRPALVKNELFYIQRPEMLEGHSGVRMTTDIMNLKWEKIEWFPIEIPTAKKDSQGVGSAITYARRYSLLVTLGLSTDEIEDDGNNSSDLSNKGNVPVAKIVPNTTPTHKVVQSEEASPPSSVPTAPADPLEALKSEEKSGEDFGFELHTMASALGEWLEDKKLRDRFVQVMKLYGWTPDLTGEETLFEIASTLPKSIADKMKAYLQKQLTVKEKAGV